MRAYALAHRRQLLAATTAAWLNPDIMQASLEEATVSLAIAINYRSLSHQKPS